MIACGVSKLLHTLVANHMAVRSVDDCNIWSLHQRNGSYYYNCFNHGNKECRRITHKDDEVEEEIADDSGYCMCHSNQAWAPLEIGFKYFRPTLACKTYIRPGEECAICTEPVLYRSDAYLTLCGHSFHRSCTANWVDKCTDIQPGCPLCRDIIPCGEQESTCVSNAASTGLDRLEDFWWNIHTRSVQLCSSSRDPQHPLGTNKYCVGCVVYRRI